MIGQQISLEYLLPLVLEHLQKDPLSEGAFYPGDLLVVTLRAGDQFWQQHSDLRDEVAKIRERAFSLLATLDEIDMQTTHDALTEAYDLFKKSGIQTVR